MFLVFCVFWSFCVRLEALCFSSDDRRETQADSSFF
jgi:hypothetical protein